MKYIRTNSLKRLFSLKWRSLEEATSLNGSKGEENNGSFKNVEEAELSPKPTWKCFSYEEISDATNGFSSGLFASQMSLETVRYFFLGFSWGDRN